jgi:aspartyl-tRNA synthetase
MISYAQSVGAKGMAYIIWTNGEEKSPIVKFMDRKELDALKEVANIEDGDVMFFLADKKKKVQQIGGHVITELGKRLELIDENIFKFCWIVDFPMFEEDEITGQTVFSHNPFSMPQGGMDDLKNKNPLDILAYQYDIVCNGIELSSGAIRNHRPEVMYKAFEIAGYEKSVVDDKFGGMINAFKLGAPPHGGIAPGVDRIVMLLASEPNIREVIAFPFNQQAQDLMMNAPSEVGLKQIEELHLQVVLPEEDEKEEEKDSNNTKS